MEKKFTPGPWVISRDGDGKPREIHAERSGGRVTTWGAFIRPASEQGEANSRLICAAPDLFAYAECSEAMATFDMSIWGPVLRANGWNPEEKNVSDFIRDFRAAALSKALGQ